MQGKELSDRQCQTNAALVAKARELMRLGRQFTPLGKDGGTILFEGFAAVEVALQIEVVVD